MILLETEVRDSTQDPFLGRKLPVNPLSEKPSINLQPSLVYEIEVMTE